MINMSSPFSTDFKEALSYVIAAILIGAPITWVFMYPAIEAPSILTQWATYAIQFLFGIASGTAMVKSYIRASRIEE